VRSSETLGLIFLRHFVMKFVHDIASLEKNE